MTASVACAEDVAAAVVNRSTVDARLAKPGGKRLRAGKANAPKAPPPLPTLTTLLGDGFPAGLGICCSLPWAEEVSAAMAAGRAPRRRQLKAAWMALWTSGVYPPRDPGHDSGMRTCLECGRDCPASPIESVHCVDCREVVNAPPDVEPATRTSSDARTVSRVVWFVRDCGDYVEAQEETGERARLKLETDAQLRKEIRRYHRGKWRPEPWQERRRKPDNTPHS